MSEKKIIETARQMVKTTIELDIPTDPAERVRRQEEYNGINKVLDGLLALEQGARLQATTDASEQVRVHAKYMADFYASSAATIAEMKESQTIARAHRALVPVATMQAIAIAIVKRVEAEPAPSMNRVMMLPPITSAALYQIIMQEFDKELG